MLTTIHYFYYITKKPLSFQIRGFLKNWLRGADSNHRPSGYEPDELPDCSTPRRILIFIKYLFYIVILTFFSNKAKFTNRSLPL